MSSRFKSTPLLLLIIFISATFATSHVYSSHVSEDGYKIWEKRRVLAEGEGNAGNSSTMILAADETHRKDPLNNFEYYNGGWNITNQHYWGSVGFTAVPFFAVALGWFAFFALCLFIICIRHCCCRLDSYGYSRVAYALSLAFLILFTIAAIVGCCILYVGQGRFHGSTVSTLHYVVRVADDTVENLRNVSGYLDSAQHVGIDTNSLAPNLQKEIDAIQVKINTSATFLSEQADQNSKAIIDVLDAIRLVLIVIAAVMLVLAFVGFLLSIFGIQSVVYFLVVIGWILVTGTFILCGVFLLLHNAVGDACVAMDEWVQNPTAHTTLDEILPCVDNATARETLLRAKETTYQLVTLVDRVINNVTNGNYPPMLRPLYFNQSGPLVPVLCNPYHSDYTDRQCASGEVELKDAREEWKKYLCQVSSSGICTTTGRLTPTYYQQMTAAANVSYGLHHYGPFLVDLQDCTFVRQTFSDITRDHCPGLRRYTQWVYIGMLVVSLAVMLSLVFWIIYARERRHRAYTKRLTGGPLEHQGKGY